MILLGMDREALVHFAGGAVGGMTGSIVTYPLDVFKVSAQSSNKPNMGPLRFTKDVIRNEGVRGLYKGIIPTLFAVVPSKAIYFWSYSTLKRYINEFESVPSDAKHVTAAFGAGFFTVTLTDPIWMVKTRLQLHRGPLSPLECTKRIFRQHGVSGFYKGIAGSYFGLVEKSIQFFIYERFKEFLSVSNSSRDEDSHFLKYMLAAGSAKGVATVATYPPEVVKTRLREENSKAKGFLPTLGNLYRQGGVRILYRGLSVQLLRSIPNSAITLTAYELVLHFLAERPS